MVVFPPRLIGLLALVVAFGVNAAEAGTPFVLPEGEDAARWRPYLVLVDLDAATATPRGGAFIELLRDGDLYVLRAVDAAGAVSVRRVWAPAGPGDREQIVSLANSLLHPATWTEPSWADLVAALPTPPATPAPRAPRTVPPPAPSAPPSVSAPPAVAVPPPVSAPPAVAVPPSVSVPPVDASLVPPPAHAPVVPRPAPPALAAPRAASTTTPPSRSVRAFVRAGGGVGWRPGVRPGVAAAGGGGVALPGGWRFGLEVAGVGPGQLEALTGSRRSGALDLAFTAAAVAPKLGLMIGVRGGAGVRVFEADDAIFAAVTVPWFGLDVGWDIALPRLPVLIEPALFATFDARRIEVGIEGEPGLYPLPQFAVGGALRLVVFVDGSPAKPRSVRIGRAPSAVAPPSVAEPVIHLTPRRH